MMIDLLNKFSASGSYGQSLHWWAMGSLVIVVFSIIVLAVKMLISFAAKKIIAHEIENLAKLLVPTLFNVEDFWTWLYADNIVLENKSPLEWIFTGQGARLHRFMVKELAKQPLPFLYDGVLNIQSKKCDK